LDPCETAAQVFKCGVDSSVPGMTNLIAASSSSGDVAAQDSQILFGKLRGSCVTNNSCVADVSRPVTFRRKKIKVLHALII